MSPKADKQSGNVVDIASSDDEGGAQIRSSKKVSPNAGPSAQSRTKAHQTPSVAPAPSVSTKETLESRSFWKAGAYVVSTTSRPTVDQGNLEHARVHPKFLHSNATSHKWAFGAIAELLDNAVDEIHNGATFVKVDKVDIMKDNSPALLFQDDGGGMDPESLRKCMSLGYSSKKANTTIGQYGNGFKTSTMRLGADAIVFSRATRGSRATQSVGLLSYTFLRRTGQDDVIVPMIDFDISDNWVEPIVYGSQEDWSSNLKTILEWSPFASKEELLLQFDDIGSHGTKIIIYNLWLNDEGIYELSFDDDDEDIQLRDESNAGGTKLFKKALELRAHISYRIRYSLRAYTSMLYLKKFNNFNIFLRGKPVQQFDIVDEMKFKKVVAYKPQVTALSKEVVVETTIGFIKEAPNLNVVGFNVYHNNRLIRPFWKVTADGSSKGSGVIGVLEANFIEPAHDKQDFERSTLYVRLETRLKQMVHDYWKTHCHLVGYQPLGFKPTQPRPAANTQKPAHQNNLGHPSNNQVHMDQPAVCLPSNVPPGTEAECHEITSDEDQALESMSIDQLCEDNIQLFMRCEEHAQKEAELMKTVEELEKQLEEAKSKCAQLAVHLEIKKREKALKQCLQNVT